jgi:hypothetical protein
MQEWRPVRLTIGIIALGLGVFSVVVADWFANPHGSCTTLAMFPVACPPPPVDWWAVGLFVGAGVILIALGGSILIQEFRYHRRAAQGGTGAQV